MMQTGFLALVWLFILTIGCSKTNFGGEVDFSRQTRSADAGGSDGSDGVDGDDAGFDDDDDDSRGGKDGGGGNGDDDDDDDDGGKGRIDGDDDSSSGGKSGGSDGTGGGDDDDDLANLDLEDDEVALKYLHNMQIQHVREDQDFRLEVQLLIKGDVKKTRSLTFPGASNVLDLFCVNDRETTINVTVHGKETMSSGDSHKCFHEFQDSDTKLRFEFDPGGFGGTGSNCGLGEDDIITLTCPKSDRLTAE